jgi:DNA-binding CsgD family transcriptional regulator
MGKLTPREREVVGLLMQGHRTRDIAAELCISRRTVKAHLDNARAKADARSVAQLAAKVAGEGE